MYSFKNDYSEGCHPNILGKLLKTNLEQQDGYGEDIYSNEAREFIKKKIENPNAEIHFVSGGTQANLIVIASVLKSYESVICANTGHINVLEAGSIEATGHKINVVNSNDGKIKTDDIKAVLNEHTTVPHMVKPKMVYISNSTEIGTVYKKEELETMSSFCKNNDLYLFVDGARLGSALCAKNNDLTLSDFSRLTDIFYIGGTKNWALLGEAIIINNDELKKVLSYHIKQRWALTAKGRILGIQFLELFREDLFFTLAKHANAMAMELATSIKNKGYSFLTEPISNQIFPILPNDLINELSMKYGFNIWGKIDDSRSVIRLVTSWATDEKIVNQFIDDLK